MKRVLIGFLIVLFFIEGVSASNITINPDNSISFNGEKTFLVGLMLSCYSWVENNGWATPCNATSDYKGSLNIDPYFFGDYNNNSILNTFIDSRMYWTYKGENANNITSAQMNHPNFGGYYQLDEPEFTYGTDTSVISSRYNAIKAKDTTHPVWMNIYSNFTVWLPYTDIISWDSYPFKICVSGNCGISYNYSTEYAYQWEYATHYTFLKANTSLNIDSVGKPTLAVLQGNGAEWNETCCGDAIRRYKVPTKQQARSQAYLAITLNVNGIQWWTGKDYKNSKGGEGWKKIGLNANSTVRAYFMDIGQELIGLNDILVLPTKYYSWQYHKNNIVLFSPNPTYTLNGKVYNKFNYILKQNSTATYLIVVNKDANDLENIQITIPELTGAMTSTTLGLEEIGSSRAGRMLSVTNGTFIDTFDGFAAHVYEIAAKKVYPRYDVNEDGVVEMSDLTLIGQHFNKAVSVPYPRYDVNMDGLVNIEDITITGQYFGEKT